MVPAVHGGGACAAVGVPGGITHRRVQTLAAGLGAEPDGVISKQHINGLSQAGSAARRYTLLNDVGEEAQMAYESMFDLADAMILVVPVALAAIGTILSLRFALA
jgi:hypothetical protein